jgi:glycosyltransferase involved in cell wall biosynthesis
MSDEPLDEPSVCIAIPFYSNLTYLAAALRSLVAQTDPRWTAVVVDDVGPVDGADRMVAGVGDDRLRYVRNATNLGVAGNFNRCLDLGGEHAEVVTVFHADDELAPGYVAAIRRAHGRFPDATCIAAQATIIDANGGPSHTLADTVKRRMWPRVLPHELVGDRGLARLMHGQFFYCPAVSYRVSRLPALRFDERWQQVMDLDLYARILLEGGSVVLLGDEVYRYRRHAGTMTAQNSQSLVRLDEEVAVSREIAAAARARGWPRSGRSASTRWTVRLNGLVGAAGLISGRRIGTAMHAVRRAIEP